MTETMTVSELISAASSLVSSYSVLILASGVIGVAGLLLRRLIRAAR